MHSVIILIGAFLFFGIAAGKGGGNMNDLQRIMDLHRQYLLEMMPQTSNNSRQGNWKS